MDKKFLWTEFYTEFADTLLQYKDNRSELIEKIKFVYKAVNIKLPKLDSDNEIVDIDPFTVFALFNKGISDENRVKILNEIASEFNIKADVPKTFDGIPVANNFKATFYCFKGERGEHDIDNLWNVFEDAIRYSSSFDTSDKTQLQNSYDTVRNQKGIKWNITIGLYWIRPETFISLDSVNQKFVVDTERFPLNFTKTFSAVKKELPDGASYLSMCEQARNALKEADFPYHSFPELSYHAWKAANPTEEKESAAPIDANVGETSYWIYSPGDNACMWDEFYENGIMGIGWDKIGCSLKKFSSKEEIKEKMKSVYDANYSYRNNGLCLWQFANEMKIGDIVFAKKGMYKIIGKGVVTSDYIYDEKREKYKNIRKVEWQNCGEWEHPGQAVMKTLTNISSYTDYVQKLLALFAEETIADEPEQKEIQYPEFTKDNFLKQVYMSEENYNTLVGLLDSKCNVILQGAPGVGKTFAAKRLAYSIMGVKDTSRVAMVQFHQSYSYEDFIQGYRPSDNGFKLENGIFYKFCKLAEEDDERPYFFIIDEINRGNLSKIFGELMILIEKDKRGEQIKLLYSNERFAVPKNVKIIGMMNTADRSLALMDYALRRRFAFFDIAPAFSSDGFKNYLAEKNNTKLDRLISVVESLNEKISDEESLGDGFRIGHSYFCTDGEITDEWLQSVVNYEVVPLLKEYWFDDPTTVREWTDKLKGAIK